ncbi:peptidase inhibitor family I36 protein [Aeromicrobium alkaliterrae]|uniref:peptidase inhibitor family I36 protein n=1 Tax=Aeromicrobium alkaliterrae TaxID=302168 RepID=UPI0031D78715
MTTTTTQSATAEMKSPEPIGSSLSQEQREIVSSQLQRQPGGTVAGNEVRYRDGTTFVAVEAGVLSLSQCTSGRFCGWSSSNYTGSFVYTTGTGITRSLSWTARSYSNNRSQGARLYNSTSSASTCFAPGESRATIGSSYYNPAKVFLSSSSSC